MFAKNEYHFDESVINGSVIEWLDEDFKIDDKGDHVTVLLDSDMYGSDDKIFNKPYQDLEKIDKNVNKQIELFTDEQKFAIFYTLIIIANSDGITDNENTVLEKIAEDLNININDSRNIIIKNINKLQNPLDLIIIEQRYNTLKMQFFLNFLLNS